eukprot:CAMPEP_0176367626 /NCGR_PEP_ID=MMETSP0126-20121128/22013_1 /TAXON_ID=141414 ORGANISM="Strombidinopsis acuminatum, Strain SPMC142" /NCGR_SAMPLE_ID=MMETSP0126 /ASSEMBLY_ACC=CAM_ASM_000229 /LENGTH=81 /DNA_ID=CAMNT_0017725525 /DNA_START=562 /DNA_END=807 /DNA_ORIENTATION=-
MKIKESEQNLVLGAINMKSNLHAKGLNHEILRNKNSKSTGRLARNQRLMEIQSQLKMTGTTSIAEMINQFDPQELNEVQPA